MLLGSMQGSDGQQTSHVNLATIGPLRVVVEDVQEGGPDAAVSVLCQVIPERSTALNTWGLSRADGWPLRWASHVGWLRWAGGNLLL